MGFTKCCWPYLSGAPQGWLFPQWAAAFPGGGERELMNLGAQQGEILMVSGLLDTRNL